MKEEGRKGKIRKIADDKELGSELILIRTRHGFMHVSKIKQMWMGRR